MVLVWYLIIFNPHGGLLKVEQASETACRTQSAQMDQYATAFAQREQRLAYCVQGVKH